MVEALTLENLDLNFNSTGFGPSLTQQIGEFKASSMFKPYSKKEKTGKIADGFLPQGMSYVANKTAKKVDLDDEEGQNFVEIEEDAQNKGKIMAKKST
jgi:hypothetical protein